LLGIATEVQRWKERLTSVLNYSVPALPLSTGLNPEHLSHDPQVVEAYRRDPLVHDRITPRLFSEIKGEIERAFQDVARLKMPILFLIPSADRIVRPDLMQQFAASLGRRPDVQVETLSGLYHEALNEATRSSVVADLLGWIERRITGYLPTPDGGGTSPEPGAGASSMER
jgi:alpha-beta hydrolase superfamily lysophospholipase